MTNTTLNITADIRHWSFEFDDDRVLWLCFDNADGNANVLSAAAMTELGEILTALPQADASGMIVYSAKSNGFVMGADIKDFTTIQTADEAYELIRQGQSVMDAVENLRCPSVAVIGGFALGGGLEFAMACKYRLALENKKPIIGLPEVQLGLHPGFGGTVRAVQISGVRAAMELMLTGKSITVGKARKFGLVDQVCEAADWKTQAKLLLRSSRPKASAPLLDKILNLKLFRGFLAGTLRGQVARKAKQQHYPAPYAIIDLWRTYGASPGKGYEAEAKSMSKLMVGSTSRNLVRVFFLQNKLKSQGAKPQQKIAKVHVVGAGVMGGDIAAWCALRGLEVTLQDRTEEYIQPAMARAQKLFDKKTYNETDRQAASGRLRADVAGEGVGDADLIIEAIYENLDAKQALYQDLQEKMKAGAVLATNTSSIPLEELRTVLNNPQRFVGIHFFNPVAQMPLVELIKCADTDPSVLDLGFSFVKSIGKYGLECLSSPGFVVNRLLMPYMAEAMHLAEEGVSLVTIDQTAEAFGMPMGPVELVDTVGIDVAQHVAKVLGSAFDRPVPNRLSEMVANKQLGRKSGQGFYKWVDGKAQKDAQASTSETPRDVTDRLMLPMVNEAVACLSEGVVTDADLLDAGVIFGTGFAPFRGGPLQYARDRGVDEIQQKLTEFAAIHGERYAPHRGWETLS